MEAPEAPTTVVPAFYPATTPRTLPPDYPMAVSPQPSTDELIQNIRRPRWAWLLAGGAAICAAAAGVYFSLR
jgi:hypothetical protein